MAIGLVVMFRELGLQLEIERIAGLLVPEEIVWRERLRIVDRGLEIEAAIGVDREAAALRRSIASTASMRRRSSASDAPPIFIFTTV